MSSSEYSSSDVSSDEESGDYSFDEDSDENSTEFDSSDEDSEFIVYDGIWEELKSKIQRKWVKTVGTAESRYSKRTHPAYAWKENLVYEKAKQDYLEKVRLEKEIVLERIEAAKAEHECATIRRDQRKKNKKAFKKFKRKLEKRDEEYQKEVGRMNAYSQHGMDALNNADRRQMEKLKNEAQEKQHLEMVEKETKRKEELMNAENELHMEKELFDRAKTTGKKMGVLCPDVPTETRMVEAMDEDQLESSKSVVLRVNPKYQEMKDVADEDQVISYFTVKLRRFKKCEHIKGEKLLERGTIHLAKQLQSGVCVHLRSIDLSWNRAKYRGASALATMFARGGCSKLLSLDLRVNDIGVKGLEEIVDAMRREGIPKLEVWRLDGNLIGDAGAKTLAHSFLAGIFKNLKVLSIRQNKIGDLGGKALWASFNAENKSKLAPKFERLDFSRNNLSRGQTIKFDPCPSTITF